MAKHNSVREEFMMKNVVLSYPNLFKAVAYSDDKEPTFSASAIFSKDHPQANEPEAIIKRIMKQAFGAEAPKVWKGMVNKGRQIVHDGEERDDKAGYDDTVKFFAAASTYRPTVVDRHRHRVDEEDQVFYPGCVVNLRVQFYTYGYGTGGVGCELKGVQFVKDGERLGGATPASPDDFPDLDDEDDAGSDWDADDAPKSSGKGKPKEYSWMDDDDDIQF